MTYAFVFKYNPYHDPETGKFTYGRGFGASRTAAGEWIGHTGKPLPEKVLAKMKQYKVPPGWKDVQVNPSDTDALQVVGKDSKGRTQYIYTKDHSAEAAAEKFQRLKDFHHAIPFISQKVKSILTDPNASQRDRDCAAIVRLIEKTGFRRGSRAETQANTQAYGASTLRKEHVSLNGNSLKFNFTGKKGVQQTHTLNDELLSGYIRARGRASGPLFNVSDSYLDKFFKNVGGGDFTLKDYRTWHGTRLANHEMAKVGKPRTKKRALEIKKKVLKVVSTFLGNTPKVAMDSYIDPTVWAPIESYWAKA